MTENALGAVRDVALRFALDLYRGILNGCCFATEDRTVFAASTELGSLGQSGLPAATFWHSRQRRTPGPAMAQLPPLN